MDGRGGAEVTVAPVGALAAKPPDVPFAVTLAAVTLIGPLAIHFFLPVIPEVKTAFGISSALAEFTFSIALIAMGVATLVYGSLSDRLGRRPMLLSGLALFLVGSAAAAVAGSIFWLIIARLVQAVGAGCSVTLTRAMARDAYGPGKLVQAIAYLTMAYTLGPMLAPPLGGFLNDRFGWRSVFWVALLLGSAISLAAWGVLGETRQAAAPRRSGVLRDYWMLFGDLRFSAFVLQSAFCTGTFFAIVAASPFLMQEQLGRSATEYGLYFFLYPAGYCIGNLISSRLSGRVSIETMVLVGSVINLAALSGQAAMVLGGRLSPLVIFAPGFIVTFAQGLALPNAQAGAMQVKPDLAGTAAGIGVFCQMIGAALFAQIYGWAANGTALPMVTAAGVAAILTLVAGVIPFATRGRVRAS